MTKDHKKTGGRQKGTKNKHPYGTVIVKQRTDALAAKVADGTLKDFQDHARASFGPLVAAQMQLAMGYMVICRRVNGEWVEVKEPDQVLPLLNSGAEGERYAIFTKPPQQAALSYVWDRLFGPVNQTTVKAGVEAQDGSRFVIEIQQTGQPAQELEV